MTSLYASGSNALPAGLHLCYNGNFNEKRQRNLEQIYNGFLSPKYFLQFENILYEGGIASNRISYKLR